MGLHLDQRYLLAAAATRGLVRRQLFLNDRRTLHFFGVKGHTAQRAKGRGHLQTGLEALATKRVSAVRNTDWFVVDLQTDGTGELTFNIFGWNRPRTRPWCCRLSGLGRLLLLGSAERTTGGYKTPKHSHNGGESVSIGLDANRSVFQLWLRLTLL